MNDIIRAMEERRSIRKYTKEAPPRELVDQVIDAGLWAANGMGTQDPKILVVNDRKVRDELSDMNRRIGGWEEGFDPFYGAPVVLIVLGKKGWRNCQYDGALVMGNMMLAAHSLGLGSCWINRAREEFETEYGKELLKKAGIEGEWEGIGHCILGYPEGGNPAGAERKPGRVYEI